MLFATQICALVDKSTVFRNLLILSLKARFFHFSPSSFRIGFRLCTTFPSTTQQTASVCRSAVLIDNEKDNLIDWNIESWISFLLSGTCAKKSFFAWPRHLKATPPAFLSSMKPNLFRNFFLLVGRLTDAKWFICALWTWDGCHHADDVELASRFNENHSAPQITWNL